MVIPITCEITGCFQSAEDPEVPYCEAHAISAHIAAQGALSLRSATDRLVLTRALNAYGEVSKARTALKSTILRRKGTPRPPKPPESP